VLHMGVTVVRSRPAMRAFFVLLTVSSGLAAFAGVAEATPPDVFGYGARHQALGMTGVAYANDYEAVFSNPAGLARATRSGISLGLQAGSFELSLDGQDFDLEAYRGSTIGFHLPIPFGGELQDVFTIGAGFYTPANTVLRTDIIFAEVPQWAVLARTQSVNLIVGLGIDLGKLVPGLRIGLGVNALATITGRLLVTLDEANTFNSLTETQLLVNYHPLVGATYDIGDWKLGLVYRAEVRSDIDLDIVVENLPVELPRINITALPQYDPHTLSAEAAWQITPHLMGALHLTYRRWSAWPGVVGKTSESSFFPVAPDFRDTVSPRLAIEYTGTHRHVDGALRFGYGYEMTPAPPARMAPGRDSQGDVREGVMLPVRYLDSDRHYVTGGLGMAYHLAGAVIRVDLFGQLHRVTERTHDIAATEAGGSPMVTSGWLVAGGWTGALEW